MKSGDMLLEQILKEQERRRAAFGIWIQLLQSTNLYGREELRKLVECLGISKN